MHVFFLSVHQKLQQAQAPVRVPSVSYTQSLLQGNRVQTYTLVFMHAAIGDKAVVYRATKPAAAKWEDIGLALEINPNELEKIRKDQDGSNDRLKEVLSEWLRGNGGECSLKFLCDAVGGDLVELRALADIIKETLLPVVKM